MEPNELLMIKAAEEDMKPDDHCLPHWSSLYSKIHEKGRWTQNRKIQMLRRIKIGERNKWVTVCDLLQVSFYSTPGVIVLQLITTYSQT